MLLENKIASRRIVPRRSPERPPTSRAGRASI